MKSKFLLALVLSLSIGLGFNLPSAISQGFLYDNFGKTPIDSTKWDTWEFVREIQDIKEGTVVDRKLVSKTTAYGSTVRNFLNFKNPDSIDSIEADVTVNTITDKYMAEDNHVIPRARVAGRFYNDGDLSGSPGSYIGDVQASVEIRKYKGKVGAHWMVIKYTDQAGNTYDTVSEGTFPVSISLNKVSRLSIQFDRTSMNFTFRVVTTKGKTFLDQTQSYTSTDVLHPSNAPWKAVGTQVWFAPAASSLSGSISATFDNVIAKDLSGTTVVNDNFSSSRFDTTKWDTQEVVREVSKGAFRSVLTSMSESLRNSLGFKNPEKIKDFQANVTLLSFENPDECDTKARLGAYFYSDIPDPDMGYKGVVWAEVAIGGKGKEPVASWFVWRNNNFDQDAGGTRLDYGEFPISVKLGETYNLSIGWDGTQITFRCNENTAHYTITTSVYPPNHNTKNLSTRIVPPS